MGIISWIKEKAEAVKDWVVEKVDKVKDFLFGKKYDDTKVEDQVDVDAVLSEFHEERKFLIDKAEEKCMDEIDKMFNELLDKTEKNENFSDLVSIIKNYQEKAERNLKGTVHSYIKEHISKNDPCFSNILKMPSSSQKRAALNNEFERVENEAKSRFYSKLRIYAEEVLEEFETRLNIRISNQEEQTNQQIKELERLKAEAEINIIDPDKIEDECAPAMEASQCIITVLNKAVI